jgi:F-type H+-transporting ATPase subunit b
MELLSKLGIDWKLLIAQVINFGILAGVLTAFVYRPLLNLLDERRERISRAMEEAKRIEGHKSEMEKIRVEKLKEIDREAGIFLERAKETAEKMKGEILSAAEKEAAELLAKGRRQLADERARVLNEVQAMLTKIILEMTEKILQREFSADDEKRLVSHLTKDLPQLLR